MFEKSLFSHLSSSEKEIKSEKLSLAMYTMFANGWDPFGEEIVSLANFGRILGFFPPLWDPKSDKPDENWLRNMVEQLSKPWFWATRTRVKTECLLSFADIGTFAVRFGSNATFRMSVKSSEEEGKKFRTFYIGHPYGGDKFWVKDYEPLKGQIFDSLEGIIEAVDNTLPYKLIPPKALSDNLL